MKKSIGTKTRKPLALLMAVLFVLGSMPLMCSAALAAEGAEQALAEAIAALVDPPNLRFYTDEAILRVADALGGGYDNAQAFLDSVLTKGYRYVGSQDPAAMAESANALRKLMATGDDMDRASLAYEEPGGERFTAIHRDESKANVRFRIVPIGLNEDPIDGADGISEVKRGDRITFAAEMETDYYVSAAELPIVYDSTQFCLIGKGGKAYSFDGDGTNGMYNIRDVSPAAFIDTCDLADDVADNYTVECFTAGSVPAQYPQAYRTQAYMIRYKILLVEMMPIISASTVPQIFTGERSRLFTFTMQARKDMTFDSSEQNSVCFPVDWYATNTERENLFAVTRAAGMLADGVTPATHGTKARLPYEIFDNAAQYGQTAGVSGTSLPTPTPDPDPEPPQDAAVLELSSHTAETGSTFDVTVTMKNNPGIIAMRIGLEYDPAVLELTKVTDGELLGSGTMETSPALDKSPFWVLWEDALKKENYTSDGTLVTFSFRVRKDARACETALKLIFKKNDTFNTNIRTQVFQTVDSTVRVYVRGDANGDGVLSNKDSFVIRRYLVAAMSADQLDMEQADFNHDGEVDLRDSTQIQRFLAGGWGVD